jgi:amino acid adenylation domain-containing protein
MTYPVRPSPGILPRGPSSGPLPLSFAQQRLWFLDQLEPNSSFYNIGLTLRLTGSLDLSALQRSLDALVARHEALRTIFPSTDGRPRQVITPAGSVPIPIDSLAETEGAGREETAVRLATEEIRRPFDLALGPLHRARLIRLDPRQHILVVTTHHIVSDGWSMSVLLRELGHGYRAFHMGEVPQLPPLPIQYADYAVWQQQHLQDESQRQLAYWIERLSGAPSVTELVPDYPRPRVQGHRGAYEVLTLSPSLVSALKALCIREHVTLFMTLMAALKTVLHRYSGQQDLVVGTHIAGRSRLELEGLIGFFISTLMLRTDLSDNPSFRTLLARVREGALGAYDHQDVPFERLIEALDPQRTLSHTPLVQVVLNMLNLPEARLELPDLTVERVPGGGVGSKFDLTLYAREHGGGITLTAMYDPDLFHGSTISRMLGHLQTLLEAVVMDPDRPLWQLPLLTLGERSRLRRGHGAQAIGAWDHAGPAGIEYSIVQRFEFQVRMAPGRLAVRTDAQAWTYEELNRAANRTAHALLGLRGSDPEPIALLLDHDAPMIGALLGALKTGKSYVPLDPRHPPARLAQILEDTRPGALVTNAANRPLARALSGDRLPLLDIDTLDTPDHDVGIAVAPDATAYVLYTSGSTGRPTGVVQSHRNVLHFIRAYTNNLRIGRDDRLTLVSSYGVDAAVQDIFAALLNGAAVYPVDLKQVSLAELGRRLVEHEITIYHSTPTVYRYCVAELTTQAFPALRLVVLGGEAVYRKDVEAFRRHFAPPCLLVNGYGLTESTVTTQYVIDHSTQLIRDSVPIGYPAADTEILLLDEAGMPTELFGEIAIRSPYLALGYLNAPHLSSRRFVPDPSDPTRRIYRTGDMGRFGSDGSLEFVGRRDHQVKLRGYRIELEEIGLAAAEHPTVSECVAILRADDADPRIVAYLVPRAERTVPIAELRSLLEARLPDYMIPSAFVVLNRLPLTTTGKLDQRALPAPAPGPQAPDGVPRTPLEQAIAAMWAEVLPVKAVGIRDNFFALGGHSLLATRVLARIQQAFRVELPLRAIFEAPTVAAMAERVTAAQRAPSEDLDSPVRPLSRDAYRRAAGRSS